MIIHQNKKDNINKRWNKDQLFFNKYIPFRKMFNFYIPYYCGRDRRLRNIKVW
jgi:hypothetical protein